MNVGDVIDGKYELVRLIGEGGMGEVYEARHRVLTKRVAIKFLHGGLAENEQARRRFMQEAKAAASIGSDHIVQVIDVGDAEDGSPYLVMELLEGTELKDEMIRNGPFEPARAAELAIQLCSALGAAHALGIVHRDLKPENVFVTPTATGDERLKVLDFGIAKFQDVHLTATGTIIGSPSYMAPEQAMGSRDVDHRADVYAVGAILFEMLTGRPPYVGTSMAKILVQVISEPPPAPRQIRADLPADLERIVLKAMARERDSRYGTMAELGRDLAAFVRSAPERPVAELAPVIGMDEAAGRADTAPPQAPNPVDPIALPIPPTVTTYAAAQPDARTPKRRTVVALAIGGALVLFAIAGVAICSVVGREPSAEQVAAGSSPADPLARFAGVYSASGQLVSNACLGQAYWGAPSFTIDPQSRTLFAAGVNRTYSVRVDGGALYAEARYSPSGLCASFPVFERATLTETAGGLQGTLISTWPLEPLCAATCDVVFSVVAQRTQ
jgi:tRNA A-37 threonylcarbamoyl transferase component Bud32